MGIKIITGIGGWCEFCDDSHDHPLNNIIEVVEIQDEEPVTDVQQLAEALSSLPEETLNALKNALGI